MIDIVIQLVVKALTKTIKVSGTRRLFITCEHCAAEYGFTIKRTASASAFISPHARQSARAAAEKKMQKELAVGVDLVSCPACGFFQPSMIRRIRIASAIYGILFAFMGCLMVFFTCYFCQDNEDAFGRFCLVNFYAIQIAALILAGAMIFLVILFPRNSSRRCAKRVANPHQRGILRTDWIAAEQFARDAVVQLHVENTQ